VASAAAAARRRRCLTKVRSPPRGSAGRTAETGTLLQQAGDAVRLPKESALTFREGLASQLAAL